jgi:hypothetical protein
LSYLHGTCQSRYCTAQEGKLSKRFRQSNLKYALSVVRYNLQKIGMLLKMSTVAPQVCRSLSSLQPLIYDMDCMWFVRTRRTVCAATKSRQCLDRVFLLACDVACVRKHTFVYTADAAATAIPAQHYVAVYIVDDRCCSRRENSTMALSPTHMLTGDIAPSVAQSTSLPTDVSADRLVSSLCLAELPSCG